MREIDVQHDLNQTQQGLVRLRDVNRRAILPPPVEWHSSQRTTCCAGSAYSFYRPMMAPMDCPILSAAASISRFAEMGVTQRHADVGVTEHP